MNKIRKCIQISITMFCFGLACGAQTSNPELASAMQIATPRADSVLNIPYGYVDLTNGNLHLNIPYNTVAGPNGRSKSFSFIYNSRTWTRWDTESASTWSPAPSLGWTGGYYPISEGEFISARDYVAGPDCTSENTLQPHWSQFAFHDQNATHVFPFETTQYCNPIGSGQVSGYAQDSSGYYATLTTDTYQAPNQVKVWSPSGDLVYNGWYGGKSSAPINSNGSQLDVASTLSSPAPGAAIYSTEYIYAPYSIFSSGWGSVGYISQPYSLLKQLTLPDGRMFSMTYDTCPNSQTCTDVKLGTLQTLTLPTGGTLTFHYGTFAIPGDNAHTVGELRIVSVSYSGEVSENCSAVGATSMTTWQFCWHTNVVSNERYFTSLDLLEPTGSSGLRSISTRDLTEYFAGSMLQNWVVKNIHTYAGNTATGVPIQGIDYTYYSPQKITGIDIVRDGVTISRKRYSYWDPDLPMLSSEREIDSNSNILRETTYSFQTNLGSTAHPSALTNHYIDRPLTMLIYGAGGSSGAVIAGANFGYDESSLSATSGYLGQSVSGLAWHDDVNFPASMIARGNLTSVSRMTSNGSYMQTEASTYNILGQRISSTDGNGHVTNFDWSSNEWGESSCGSAAFFFFQTHVKNAQGQEVLNKFNSCTGTLYSVLNPNDLATAGAGTVYSYDAGNRIKSISAPDGGQTTISYTDGPNSTITRTIQTGAQSAIVTKEFKDAFGRTSSTQTVGGSTVDTSYDFSGRPTAISNPYIGTASGAYTSLHYDALGRKTYQYQQDGVSYLHWAYSGNTTDSYDELGHHWQQVTDAFGRLVDVYEPNPSSNNPSLHTYYSYDILGNVIAVTQSGVSGETPRTRSFTYDSLSRLITSSNPETGTVCYGVWSNGACINGYDANGNLLYKTDARGIAVNYSYDALNRLVSKTYSNDPANTLSTCYQYDSTSVGYPNGNFIGRLTHEWTQFGGCSATLPSSGVKTRRSIRKYDAMGRVKVEERCVVTNCTTNTTPFSLHMDYDLAGNLIEYDNGIRNLTFTQAFDPVGRLNKVTSSVYDAAHPNSLYNVSSFFPNGTPAVFDLGLHLNTTQGLDNRLRPTTLNVVVK